MRHCLHFNSSPQFAYSSCCAFLPARIFLKPSVLVQPQKNGLLSRKNVEKADESAVLQNANSGRSGGRVFFWLFAFTWRHYIASSWGSTNSNEVTTSLHPTTTGPRKCIKSVLGYISEKGHWFLQKRKERKKTA